jgi:hypothetical protein
VARVRSVADSVAGRHFKGRIRSSASRDRAACSNRSCDRAPRRLAKLYSGRITREWSRRARCLVRPCRRGAQLIRNVGRTCERHEQGGRA